MPSSLIFAGLVVAWLLILVPMIARRRQEVVRPSDAALACRVLDRPTVSRRAEEATEVEEQEEQALPDKARHDTAPAGDETEPPKRAESFSTSDDGRHADRHEPDRQAGDDHDEREPRFRPGRGGFDPEAAALAAGARYAFRQRVVLGLLLAAMATALIAFFGVPAVWWLHGLIDLVLLGYLSQLRRQVRMEDEIRQRRGARMAGSRRPTRAEHDDEDEVPTAAAASPTEGPTADAGPSPDAEPNELAGPTSEDSAIDAAAESEPETPGLPPLPSTPQQQRPSGTCVVELDDEDPELDQLDGPAPRYRRAVGE